MDKDQNSPSSSSASSNVKRMEEEHAEMDLRTAAKNGILERVRMIVEQGADKGQSDVNGCTPLYLASLYGHFDVVEYLVEQGASLDKTDNDGWTPLIAAVSDGHLEIARYLLE